MRIETIYDQGTIRNPEDQIIIRPPFFGVADGVSGLYLPSEGPILFEGQSGGQMTAETLLQTVAATSPSDPLEEVIIRANTTIWQKQKHLGFYETGQIELLAGTTFAIAKIEMEKIEIIQCGDCFALWVTNNEVGITKNQSFHHVTEALKTIATLMEKHKGSREKMWQEFGPILTIMRRRDVNKECGYGLLNGQPESKDLWQRFILRREEISLLLLFTDGLVYYPGSGNEQALAEKVLKLFRKGRLRAILENTRQREERKKQKSHIDHAEASSMAIEF
ncbi:MAG: protein phosphatase 2C domain-containing protein [bacterium]|nr:protein phosphatase 2C domain-containing protein [bacterium]